MQEHDSRQTPRLQAAPGSAGNHMAMVRRVRLLALVGGRSVTRTLLGWLLRGRGLALPLLALVLSLIITRAAGLRFRSVLTRWAGKGRSGEKEKRSKQRSGEKLLHHKLLA